MYLATVGGWIGCVSMKDLMMEDINMLVIVGENATPIAVPFI